MLLAATETAGRSRELGPAHLIHASAYACMHACVCVIEGLTEKMRMEKVEAIQENLEDSRSIRHTKVLLHVVHLYQGPNELGTCKPTAMWHADACPLTCPQTV